MFYWKEYVLVTAAFVMLSCAWHLIYIKPHANVRTAVHDCMMEINDQSIQGYSFCRRSLRPTR